MRHHLLTPAVVTASLAVAVAASAAVTTAAGTAAAATAAATVAATARTGRPVFLVTGELITAGTAGPAGVSVTAGAPGQGPGPVGPLQTLSLAGKTYALPVTAVPYLGRGLDPGLFEPTALAGAEPGGRLPVRVAYSGGVPALPGVTITAAGNGAAQGYLTAAGARTFGAALARQFATDHPRGSYGQDGLFGGGVDVALAGAPRPAPAPRPAFPMDTLTVTATNLRGRPDTGDLVIVANVDNLVRFVGPYEGRNFFYHGTAKFSVPAGHYWAVGVFLTFGTASAAERLVVLPQFTVGGATTVHLAERSASSQVGFATPRPAALRTVVFTLFRQAASGGLAVLSWLGGEINGISLWVSPTASRPTAGTLQSETSVQLTSPPGAPGAPYAYHLAYPGPPGIIPAQHFSVRPASLATVHEHYYQDVPATGSWCTLGGLVLPNGAFAFFCEYFPLRLPGTQTQYLSAGPNLVWQASYGESPSGAGGQTDEFRAFRLGQQVTQDWNAYPLHPQPDVQVLHGLLAAVVPAFPSAFRAGNTLTLFTTPFSDNYPGHLGTGFAFVPGVTVRGSYAIYQSSYAIYQNGTQIAHGDPARGIGPVRLSPNPSVIRFVLAAARPGPLFRLSPASTTTWAWRSAPRPHATVPRSWACGLTRTGYLRRCAVQPMMTLTYQVAGLAPDGTAPAGPQTIDLSADHLQLARAARVTGAAATVSFDNGHTFRAAAVTPLGGGRFRITFTAPAGAAVTLRVHAADAAGGSVSETILRGYQVAPRPANGAAR